MGRSIPAEAAFDAICVIADAMSDPTRATTQSGREPRWLSQEPIQAEKQEVSLTSARAKPPPIYYIQKFMFIVLSLLHFFLYF